jgi:SAM-dependent MidA family methyltransferase
VTGGTGSYRSAGGDGTLVEFGDGTGRLTLHLLRLATR